MLTNYVQKMRTFLARRPRAPVVAVDAEATGYHPPHPWLDRSSSLPEPQRTPPMPRVKPPGNEQP